jgi:hypothetical protein
MSAAGGDKSPYLMIKQELKNQSLSLGGFFTLFHSHLNSGLLH